MSRKKKEIKMDSVFIEVSGYELQEMLTKYFKEKFGDNFDINYMEFMTEKLENEHILDHEDNEFKLFVEFTREV